MHSICTFACVLVNAFQKERPCSRPQNPLKESVTKESTYKTSIMSWVYDDIGSSFSG